MSTAAGRGEQTTKTTLNWGFLSLSEGKVEKGNEKVMQNTADTTTTLKEFDFDPQRHPFHFSRKMLRFLGSKTQALVLGKSTVVAFCYRTVVA